mgnify:CR=1 FL=1
MVASLAVPAVVLIATMGSDLLAVLREGHKYARYYVKTDKQPVGMMSIEKLQQPQSIENDLADEEV